MALAALENTHQLDHTEPVDLAELVNSEIASKHSHAQQKHISWQFNVPTAQHTLHPAIQADRFLLHQAISKLLDNALQFAPHNSEIIIAIDYQTEQQRLLIKNQGAWIPEYALARIYERFYSLARPDGSGKSSGLGLTFVQEIAALHKGSIHLTNGGTLTQPQVEAKLTLPVKQ